ncbi:MAG TPA: RecQ family ATP-dependent DNA helicase [Thermomicrobiales bacterium]
MTQTTGRDEVEHQARVLLARMLGPDATFRDGQMEAIHALVAARARVLVVQRTGWGKSLVYFLATRLLRDRGTGPTVLISPLLSLMRNQIAMADRLGIRARTINSANDEEWDEIARDLAADRCDALMISPERLGNERFRTQTLPLLRRGIGLFVVDEAHCISDWGHDFRPDYRRIVQIVRLLPPSVPVLATTATANDRVVADVATQLGPDLLTLRGPLARPTLRLQTIRLDDQAERLAWLAQTLPIIPGSGIVYCLTVGDCDRVAAWLGRRGIDAAAYHADLPPDRRVELEARLIANQTKALVATVALGMGFDKPDLGFVVHYQRPGSVVAYYQQIGRAGRAGSDAFAILLNGREDDDVQEYFITSAFPGAADLRAVLAAIEGAETDGLTARELQTRVNLSHGKIERCLKFLEVEGAVVHEHRRYGRTVKPWSPDEERSRRVTALRYHELARMQAFVDAETCLMEFVGRELDDPTARPCGRCAVCCGTLVPTGVDPALVAEAVRFLKRDARRIEPRVMLPTGVFPDRKAKLEEAIRNEPGLALCVYGDAGWGRLVTMGKYRDGRFADELVDAAVDLIRRRWQPAPAPGWVTAVPSLRHPGLVPDFAARLAGALELPFRPALVKVRETPEQKTMQNSAQQVANIASAFRAEARLVLPGPVLLVDDIVDSRWTFTTCGAWLRRAGSGPVIPFALATMTGIGDTP